MKVLICIPTYNERDNVRPLVQAIRRHAPQVQILFIEDNSPDGTGAVVDELVREHPDGVHVLHRKGKGGLASAYLAGFAWGLERGFDWLWEMDADFSHDPAHLPGFLEQMQSGRWDAVCGSRYVPGGGVVNWEERRFLLSKLGSLYSQIWLRYPVADWTGGFNAWRSSLLQRMGLASIQSKGYCFQIELRYRALVLGARLLEQPIIFQERRAGASRMSGSIVKEALLGVVKLRWRYEQGTLLTPVAAT